MMKVYVAGPLFSEAELRFNERIRAVCTNTLFPCVVFLPQENAGLQDATNGETIFRADLKALVEADLVVANLDGPDVDAGTAWEIGYAVAHGTPVVGVRTDRRVLEPFARVNLMIERSVTIVTSLDALRAQLLKIDRNQEKTP